MGRPQAERETMAFRKAAGLAAVLLVALGGAPAAVAQTQGATAATQMAPAIRVVRAERRELVETISVTGTVLPRQEAAVGTDLSGLIVTELSADQGDMVEKGQVVARLDRSSLDTQMAQMEATRAQALASVAQAEAQIADARVGLRQAEEGLTRARALQDKGVATQAQLDNAVNAYDSAQARLVSAERAKGAAEAQVGVIDAQKKNVELQIAKTEVKAPASGLVLERSATLGGVVGAGAGPLFRIAMNAEFELVATVAETSLHRLEPGMPVAVTVAGATEPVEGTIRLVSPEIDQASRLGRIRISLERGGDVRAGNFARATIETLRREGVAVPASAVIFRGRDAFLQKVVDGVVSSVPVRVGVRAEGVVEILDGLQAGDEVVGRAGTFVADGDRVTPVRSEERTGALAQ
jgi:HlyD family secretion protein